MSNLAYEYAVDQAIDMVDTMEDWEVLQRVQWYVVQCERMDVNVDIDEAREFLIDQEVQYLLNTYA
jgi:hypothetical protein